MEDLPSDHQLAQWRDERNAELAKLPAEVARTAHVYENGEVSWSNEHAEAAINALADEGFLILGLDARKHFPGGGVMETPISDYTAGLPPVESTPDARRTAALTDVSHAAKHGDYVLVSYSPPEIGEHKI